ncbi:unnamed protein product [Caenorhabditis sp. 36 PRJEB53466]|nr:unnamed protein product [Caenorhabditis sp. 36 PRJEB53466]
MSIEMTEESTLVMNTIREAMDTAFRRERIESARYMAIYTTAYTYVATGVCLKVDGDGGDKKARHMYDTVINHMTDYVRTILDKGVELSGEVLLEFYTIEWKNYRFSTVVIDGMLAYLNRHWAHRKIDEKDTEVCVLYKLAIIIWKREMFDVLETKLISAVLDLIKAERNGQIIKTNYISGLIACLREMGIEGENRKTNKEKKLDVYKASFEVPFIEATAEFYDNEARQFLRNGGSVSDYMKKVEKRLEEEYNRVQLYLHTSTKTPLIAKCTAVLIADRLPVFEEQLAAFLVAHVAHDDLSRMYLLCSEVENGTDGLRDALERFVLKEGLTAMEEVAEKAIADPKLYVHTLLVVYKRYWRIVKDAFNNDAGFLKSLDKATAKFCNSNAVTERTPLAQKYTKTAELLARYVDSFLRKSSKNPEEWELEELLNDSISVFKFVEDKDVFLRYHTRLFSKRLIGGVSASDEAEQIFISKLKDLCGFQYTMRLSNMVSDVQVSRDLAGDYKEKRAAEQKDGSKSTDLAVLVLSTAQWPVFPMTNVDLPRELSSSLEAFTEFYNTKFSGRKLTWVYSQSKGEVHCNAFSKKFVFAATAAQMSTLLLFNTNNAYTFNEISEATKMDAKTTAVIVGSLVKFQVLTSDVPLQGDEAPNTATVSFNKKYSSKKVRVDLTRFSVKVEAVKDQETVERTLEADRKHEIDACIVRIMKMRKTCSHQTLMSEVISQLSSRFKPQVEKIKKCIGSLIDKDYMKRKDNERDQYEYIV